MKLNCIIDTCSCVYLNRVEFRQKTLLRHLFENVNICVSKEVSLEIDNHSGTGLPKFIQKKNLIVSPVKYKMDDYETRMLGTTLTTRVKKGNKGEIDNFIVAVDQVHHVKKGAMVYITDDKKAINGSLDTWMDAFPSIRCWSSYDVVLFLYAENIIPSKDIAVDMIKDVNAIIIPDFVPKNEKTTIELIKILAAYNKRIANISQIFK